MASRDDMYKVTLKSWLYERIQENVKEERYKGLKWIDEANLIFQLPWVTENDPHWKDYYKLFHDWAKRDGSESTDSQKAKRNFRSALNHSKHFRNLKEQGENLQTGSYKVYKFLTQEEITREKGRKPRNISEDSASSQIMLSPESQSQGIHQYTDFGNGVNIIQPGVMHDIQPQNHPCLLQSQFNGHGFQNDLNAPQLYCGNDQGHDVPAMIGHEFIVPAVGTATCDVDMNVSIIPSTDSDAALSLTRNVLRGFHEDLGKFRVTVEYNGKRMFVQEIDISNDQYGSRILYEESPQYRIANTVYLCGVNIQEEPGLHKILENMKRGLHISIDPRKLEINVRRECLAHAYYFVAQGPRSGHLQAIKRKQDYQIFSYEALVNSLNSDPFQDTSSIPAVCSDIEIVVGVQPKPDQHGKCVKGVKITLHSHAALKISARPLQSDEVMLSHSSQAGSVEPMNCD